MTAARALFSVAAALLEMVALCTGNGGSAFLETGRLAPGGRGAEDGQQWVAVGL